MNGNFDLIRLVIGLPIAAFLVLALGGKWLSKAVGKRFVGALAVLPLAVAFGIALKLTMDLAALPAEQRSNVVHQADWIATSVFNMPFEWLVDPLSMTMTLIITGIGALIFLYSTGYMSEERDYARFFTYLNLFAASMLILVLGNNLGLLFLGWEGVGLCSYLLIGFWFKDTANAKAANKAFVVNRIGDWGLTLGIFLIFALLFQAGKGASDGRTLSYDHMLPALQEVLAANPAAATAIALLLFIGAAGKSAQFPLYLWLPDAMAGPTPVSALIHAATMVTSGVVLLNRMHIVFELSPVASAVIAVLGAFTALFAALIAFGQTDIKKVLAYSTVSQLGFMFIAVGSGAYWAGMFHVTTHAFFKALLFLGAGAVIHAMAHNQDMRNYGGLKKYLPITTATMVVGWLAISAIAIPGVFGFAGWYSKEAILGSALAGNHAVTGGVNLGAISGWVGLGVALLTSVYMTRLTFLTFFGKEERWRAIPAHSDHGHDEAHAVAADSALTFEPTVHIEAPVVTESHPMEQSLPGPDMRDPHGFFMVDAPREEHEHHHELDSEHRPKEVPPSMWFPLVVLAALSLFGGFLLSQNHAFEHWLYPGGRLPILGEVSTHPHGLPLEWLSFGAALLGLIFGWMVYSKGLPKDQGLDEGKWSSLRLLQRDQFAYDRTLTVAGVEGGGDLARGLWRWVDVGLVDGFVNGTGWIADQVGRGFRRLQTGYIRGYALAMLLGVVGILGFFLLAMNVFGGRH
ncbi:MAG: NADH-quinone oxidoreductase subunit L [Fimbriimonas sp.]